MNLSLSDFIVPVFALGLVINSGWSGINEGWTRKYIIEIIIGVVVMGFSWWTASDNNDKQHAANKRIGSLNNKIDSLASIIHSKDSTILSVGLKIDDKTNKILVLDSQILQRQLLPNYTINNYFKSESTEKYSYRNFISKQGQTVFLTPNSTGEIEKYTVVRNGAFIGSKFYTVKKGALIFIVGLDDKDDVYIKWPIN